VPNDAIQRTSDLQMLPELCTLPVVADFLGVSIPTLNRWAGTGYGPVRIKFGRAVRVRKADLLAWVDEQASKASA